MRVLLYFALLPAVLPAQEVPAATNLITETVRCQNGSAGTLYIQDSVAGLFASANLGRVESCDSTTSIRTPPMGECSVATLESRSAAPATGAIVGSTPSSSTPAMYSYDAGPALVLRAPGDREIRLNRQIAGPATSYLFQEFRLPDFSNPLNPLPANPFVRSGRYTLRGEGGRDVPAFEREFEVQPVAITKPADRGSVSGQAPLTVEWNGGPSDAWPALIAMSFSSGSGRSYAITCRIPDGRSGTFTFPAPAWNEVPAAARSGGVAGLSISAAGPTAVVDVPQLDQGLQVFAQSVAIATAVLLP